MTVPEVAVLMPTIGTAARAPLLRRALESVLGQEGVRAAPIVVCNGPAVDRALVEELRARDGVRTLVLDEPGLPNALRAGRALVESAWLAELDDDDELLPGALARRLAALEAAPDADAVVTDGVRRGAHADRLHIGDVAAVEADPLRQLVVRNWLLPGAWLCRSETLPEAVFARMPAYLETTYLGLTLASTARLRFLAEATMVYHDDTPGSLSKSVEYVLGQEPALRQILTLDLPADVRDAYASRLWEASARAAAVLGGRRDVVGAVRALRRCYDHGSGRRIVSASARAAVAVLRG